MGDLMLFLLSALAAGLVGYNISSSPMMVELYEAGARADLREVASSMIVGVWIPGIAESIYFDVMPVVLMAAVYFVGVDREQGYALLHFLAGGSRMGYYVQRILLAPLVLLSAAGLSSITGLIVVDSYIATGAPALAGLIVLTVLAVVGVPDRGWHDHSTGYRQGVPLLRRRPSPAVRCWRSGCMEDPAPG